MNKIHLRNNSIDMFRFLCAILVVSIHTRPLEDINPYLGYIAVEILPRIAVPFFYCISGYFYIKRIECAKENIYIIFKKTFIKLFKIYVFWSLVFFFCDIDNYFNSGMNWKGIITSYFLNFFIFGSYYHLWYFVGLFFSIIIVTIFYSIHSERLLSKIILLLYVIGVLGCAYYEVGIAVPVLSNIVQSNHFELLRRIIFMALPFYMSGYFVLRTTEEKWKLNIHFKLLSSAFLFIIEIVLVNYFQLSSNIILTVSLYPLVINIVIYLLRHSSEKYYRLGALSKYLANFIYFSHPIFIMLFQILIGAKGGTLLFIGTTILSVSLGYILMKLNCKRIDQFVI